MKTLTLTLIVLMVWSCSVVHSNKILMMLPFGSKSHKNVFDPVAEVLAQKGHQVSNFGASTIATSIIHEISFAIFIL